MAINANREQARLNKSEELLKKNPEDSDLQMRVKNGQAALEKQEASYPKQLKRHLRKVKKYGWTDSRVSKKN